MRAFTVLYVLVMVAIIVSVDVAVLRHRTWERLIFNIAVVAVFLLVYAFVLRGR